MAQPLTHTRYHRLHLVKASAIRELVLRSIC
jgi:hypothetical protein